MLESLGPHKAREPCIKHLEGKLWEIQMKGQPGIARAIYITAKGQRIIVLHAFVKKHKKRRKLPLSLLASDSRRPENEHIS